ncbi:FAD-dependent oxidoreductase [Saccharibacillus sp. CPCC 101409]|uniref:FAD-dependent oxidoreductase n=1 Tax=Saccharibacillus sp. CPCC 101409 TaxID=3058041 RepID=UPI002671ECC3|nr:FAD-dependent oxidoreductase [Saccharibacillus sp. CPCC 101409]MDO3411262.1 FAD-dependent oxidoreductase [Saccharibacillus sp. CPCC 101409]
MLRRNWKKLTLAALAAFVLLAGAGLFTFRHLQHSLLVNHGVPEELLPVVSVETVSDEYDVVVAGTDPEGVTAAISSARNGLKVLLVDGHDRQILGGLMTVGWLNMIDLNYSPKQPFFFPQLREPHYLNKGIFQEWYNAFDGTSFDVNVAANAFYKMVKAEPNIDLLMETQSMEPVVETADGESKVTGMNLVLKDGSRKTVQASAVIDATQNADVAAAAGAGFTLGREDIGDTKSVMASTLVFRMKGVTQEIWQKLGKHEDTGIDRMSVWGYNEAREYTPSDPTLVRMRGLNIGRQNDGTILINSMQLFGVDPLDPESIQKGIEVGTAEAPRIVEYLKQRFPEMATLEYDGVASELYLRESRHLKSEYRLTLADVMENRTHWDDIAFGSYPVDIQSTNDGRIGTVLMKPSQYGVPLRTLIPQNLEGLLVVGRSAGFDTAPHGSSRTIPVGMATAQAAGAAVKLAQYKHITLHELAASESEVAELQKMLRKQGMDLSRPDLPEPEYMKHKDYAGLLTVANMYLTSGGYENDGWNIDGDANVQRFFNAVRVVRSLHPDFFPGEMQGVLASFADPAAQALTLETAAGLIASAMDLSVPQGGALDALVADGLLQSGTLESIGDTNKLTNGDFYMLLHDLAAHFLTPENPDDALKP